MEFSVKSKTFHTMHKKTCAEWSLYKMKRTKTNKLKKQTSETFRLSAILAISGGFQDAYTYNVRDEVFSNAQTGNVVLMSQNFMSGEWIRGLHYLFPIIAFALGVFVAERIQKRLKYVKKIHWRQIIVLMELAILFVVGLIPDSYNMAATMLVSFACSMQVQTFRKVNGYGYASTMCIGNLRSGTESLSIYMREKKPEILKKALHYYGIIFVFAIGAGIGGILSLHCCIERSEQLVFGKHFALCQQVHDGRLSNICIADQCDTDHTSAVLALCGFLFVYFRQTFFQQ